MAKRQCGVSTDQWINGIDLVNDRLCHSGFLRVTWKPNEIRLYPVAIEFSQMMGRQSYRKYQ